MRDEWRTVQGEPLEFAVFVEGFQIPAVRLGGGADVAENGVDVNRRAVVAAVIFAETLHNTVFGNFHGRQCLSPAPRQTGSEPG